MDLVFWPACVRLKPFRDHVLAAAAGGFTSMAIAAETVYAAQDDGMSIGEIRRIAEDAGVPIKHFDTLTAWAPIRVPPNASAEMLSRFDVPLEPALEICDKLGVTNILAVGGYPAGSVPQGRLIKGFADLCGRADSMGIWVDLEFMPILGCPDLAAAWSIVRQANAPNSGIMIDTWHLAKSRSDLELLGSIDARRLRSIQLSDGYEAQRGESVVDDLLFHREFPGDGELAVAAALTVLRGRGSLRHVGSEVFAHRANAMSAQDTGRYSGDTTRKLMKEAGMAVDMPQTQG